MVERTTGERTDPEYLSPQVMMQDAPIGICVIDDDLRFRWTNRAFQQLLGYSAEELIGLSVAEVTHPDDVEIDLELAAQALSGEIPYFTVRKRHLRADGSIMVGDLIASVIFNSNGEPNGGLALLLDAQQADPTTRLVETLQRSAVVGQLTVGLAHDLRNSLSVFRSVEDLLRLKHGVDPALDLLGGQIDAALKLVDSMVSYVAPDDRCGQDGSVDELIEQAASILRLVVPAQTSLEYGDLLPAAVRIDPGEFQQVLLNLVLNARDATAATGGTIRITTTRPSRHPRCVDVSVHDDGIGMDVAGLRRAFEPYFSTKGENGTGLGLAISREIIERNGGALFGTSEPGVGSRFTMRLPQPEPLTPVV